MNNGLGLIMPSGTPAQTYYINPRQVVTDKPAAKQADFTDYMVAYLLQSREGKKIAERIAAKPFIFWRQIIYDTRLSPIQKFEKIFGVKAGSYLTPTLGDIFSDINDWFKKTFSIDFGQTENFMRRVSQQSQNIANAMNVFRNSPNYDPSKETELYNKLTQTSFQAQDFISKLLQII